jgi:PAS domain-containing protein
MSKNAVSRSGFITIAALGTLLGVVLDFEWNRGAQTTSWFLLTTFACLLVALALAGFMSELAHRQKAERNFTEQRKLLESILNSCSDAVVVADRSGKVILQNPAANAKLPTLSPGTPLQEIPQVLGFYKSDGVTLFSYDELALPRSLRGETVTGLEICMRPPDEGEPVWLLEAGSPLIDDLGERNGGMVFLRDITDRKRADTQSSIPRRIAGA